MKTFLLAFILIFSHLATAEASASDLSQYSQKDQAIYQQTLKMCPRGAIDFDTMSAQLTFFNSSMSQSGVIAPILLLLKGDTKSIHNLSISETLQDFFNSYAFEDALNKCFTSQSEKNLFMISMIAADIGGKATSFLGDISLAKGVFYGLKAALLVRGVQQPTYIGWFMNFLSAPFKQGFNSKLGSISISYVAKAGINKGMLITRSFKPFALTPMRLFQWLFAANVLKDVRNGIAQGQKQVADQQAMGNAMGGLTSPIDVQIKIYESKNELLCNEIKNAKKPEDKEFLEFLLLSNLQCIEKLSAEKNKQHE